MQVAFATSKIIEPETSSSKAHFYMEKRAHARTPARDLSEIFLVGTNHAFACMVQDLSETGAKLQVSCGILPNKFALVNHTKRTRTLCKTIWRKNTMIGVRFISRPRPMTMKDTL
ncbi:MAG: hypothetical protein COC17_03945 [Hyphomicrobiales bacterium]|nr:PilZ domain-containing protein [Hyphomicrobiales bacterium]PCH50735.1 MAG: hypothetical protein COC17_03945 [Hyphomicrobiales bacterium]